jgi:hypothetical protein
MTENPERDAQTQRLREAVDRKAEEAQAHAEEESLVAHQRPQGAVDPRTKNSGHGQKTADKWNQ